QDGFEQGRLAGAVGSEHRHEVTLGYGQADVVPDRTPVQGDAGTVEHDRRRARVGTGPAAVHRPVAWPSARCSACSSAACQSWKLAEAGSSVSVIATTGIPSASAFRLTASTSGTAFCRL